MGGEREGPQAWGVEGRGKMGGVLCFTVKVYCLYTADILHIMHTTAYVLQMYCTSCIQLPVYCICTGDVLHTLHNNCRCTACVLTSYHVYCMCTADVY